jgi:formylglycine-generating enzyme required for sulfatase activity
MNIKYSLPVFASLLLASAIAAGQADFSDGDEFRDNLRSGGTGPLMVVIPAGRLDLGQVRGTEGGSLTVSFDNHFAVGAHEVTAGEYRQFLSATKSVELRNFPIEDDSLPVYGVSWDDAEAYVTWLSRETGHHYRLPSATEWEYAARAGTTTTYHWGNDLGKNLANCLDCESAFTGKHAPVGSFPPNRWKLYDMHGNVWEWTKDCVDPNSAPPPSGLPQLFGNCDSRELRSGSAESDGWSIRASARAFAARKMKADDTGFRVVMDIPE